jgi:hypothetical protein
MASEFLPFSNLSVTNIEISHLIFIKSIEIFQSSIIIITFCYLSCSPIKNYMTETTDTEQISQLE